MKKSDLLKLFAFVVCVCILISCSKTGNKDNQIKKSPDENIQISISTYAKNSYLEEAAKQYMDVNSNVKIEIVTFAPDLVSEAMDALPVFDLGNDGSAEKYIKNVNAALMSGQGFDIINMDVLPYYRYVESGFLENLEPLMNNDPEFIKDDLYTGMLDAMKFRDGIYMLPVDYTSFVARVGLKYESGEIVTGGGVKISDIVKRGAAELSRSRSAGNYLYFDANRLFDIIYEGSANKFLNFEAKECNFASPEFIDILETCKGFIDDGIVPDIGSNGLDENEYYFQYDSVWTQDMLMPYFGLGGDYGTMTPVIDEEGKAYFKCPHAFAISGDSRYKEECWKFLKYLVSEQAQSSAGVFPINKKALKNGFSNQIMQIFNDAAENGMPIEGNARQITDEYIGKIEEWSEKVTSYHYDDPLIAGIINAEVTAFFEGRQDAQNTAEKINERVNTYLKE